MLKNTRLFLHLAICIFAIASMVSCNKAGNTAEILANAEQMLEQQPDSVLKMLNSILYPENLSKRLFNRYNLLLLQAKDKSYKDIASDTVIFAVKDYYIRKKEDRNAALAAFYCARVLHEQKTMDKAFKAYSAAIEIANKTHDYNLTGLIQGNLGILYSEHLLYEKAIMANKKAVEMYKKAGNHKNEISALRLIGNCFVLENKTDSAFRYYDESLKLAEQYNLVDMQSSVRQSEGVAYREKGYYGQAKAMFKDALAFSPDSVEQVRILLNIAKVYIAENKPDSVKIYLDKALALQIQDPSIIRTSYFLRSKMEKKSKNYQEALKYYEEYHGYTYKVFDSEKNNKLLELQEKYDFEKIKNSNNQLTIEHQRMQNSLLFALLAAGLVIFIIYQKSIQRKKLLIDLEQKIVILQQMEDNFSKENQSFRNIVIEHFEIIRKTALINLNFAEKEKDIGQKLLKKINHIVYGQDMLDWNKLYEIMNNLQNGIYDRIKECYPQLKEMEFRVLCLTCEKLDDAEIAIILDKSIPMIRKIRNKIRTDIGMPKFTQDFSSFFKENLSIMK